MANFRAELKKLADKFKTDAKAVGVGALKVVSVADEVGDAVEPELLPFLGPVPTAILKMVFNEVGIVENSVSGVQQGVAKHEAVGTIAVAQIPNLNAVIAAFGKGIVISPAAATSIGNLINAVVAVCNELPNVVAEIAAKAPPAPVA